MRQTVGGTRWVASWSLLAALALLDAPLRCAQAACLQSAVPVADRVGIPNVQGPGEVPFGLWVMNWDSAKLASHVAKLLAEEILGYHSRFSGVGSSSHSGLYATAGCLEPNSFATDPKCGSGPSFVHHASLEVWGLSKITTMRERLSAWPEVIPEDAGDMGYEGIQGTYVFTEQKESAYQAEGLALEYYRSYDAAWTQPWEYFDNYTSFDPAELRPCHETRFMDSIEIRKYLNVTGDRDGVVEHADGTLSARCWHGAWWFAPACRSNPERCVPSVTGSNGWFVHDFMQRAAAFNMPMALTVGRTNALWRSVARKKRCLPYWWQPDSSFIDLQPTILTFPPYNALERAQGVRTSMADSSRLSKWMHSRLGTQASRLRAFLLRVSLTMSSINEMLLQNKLRSGAAHEQVACEWIRANEDIWRPWIPIKTECIPGTGLVAAGGSFVTSRASASACAWCAPGRYSTEYHDHLGTTHLCAPCEPGRSQPNPGQLACDSCKPGSFAEAFESQECEQCALGTFRNGSAGVACDECGAPMTTRVLGATSAAECICPPDMYKPLVAAGASSCMPCPEGMECKLGSDEANIPAAGGAAAPGDEHPRPLPKYYAASSEPLSVYLCLDELSCPGGALDACSANMDGAACGRCAEGYYRTVNSGCRNCGQFMQSREFLAVLVLVVGPLLCYLACRLSHSPLQNWGGPSNAIFACAFLTLIYLQVVAVMRMCYLIYPRALSERIEWTAFVLDLLAPVRPECTDFSDFQLGFVLRLLMPAYPLLVFAGTWLVSRAMEKAARALRVSQRAVGICHLDGHVVMGCYGGLYNTFFVGIAAQLLALFQCYRHPNGRSSLRSSPDVLCGSETWQALLWPAALATLVFCGGALALFAYVNRRAPAHFHDEAFRNKWRFLFMSFRPSVWWWGMLLLVKGVLLNLTTVIFGDAHLQLAWLSLSHLLYLVACFALLPWRSLSVSALDVFTHAMLLLFLSLLPHFTLQSQATSDDAAVLTIVSCFVPLLGTLVVVLAQVRLRLRPTTPLQWQAQAEELCSVLRRVRDAEEAKLVLETLPSADLLTLRAAERMLQAEIMGEMAVGNKPSRRLSMRHARTERASRMQSAVQRGSQAVETIRRSWELSDFRNSLQLQMFREGEREREQARAAEDGCPVYIAV